MSIKKKQFQIVENHPKFNHYTTKIFLYQFLILHPDGRI